MTTPFDRAELAKLGRDYRRHRDAMTRVRADMTPHIRSAAEAGYGQQEIVQLTGLTREVIRQECLSDEQREAEREARRARTRKS
jgi:hypothetical protein